MRIPRLLNCKPEERRLLGLSLDRIRLLAENCLPEIGLGRLGLAIGERLDGAHSVTITCRDSKDSTTLVVLKGKDGSKIDLMRPAFELAEEQLTALLFRVFVTLCGGTALDAAALEHHCMPGASPMPAPAGFALFARCPMVGRFRAGHFVLWDPRTGELFARRDGQGGPGEQLASVMRQGEYRGAGARPWPPPEPCTRPEPEPPAFPEPEPPASPEPEPPASPEPEPPACPEPEDSDCSDSGPERRDPGDLPPADPPLPPPQPSRAEAPPSPPRWDGSPLPYQHLLSSLQLPPEGGELLRELADLGPHTPQEWSRIMDRLTQRLLKRIADGKGHRR